MATKDNKGGATHKSAKLKPRNPVARSPLLKKGGAHEQSKTAQRRSSKEAVKSEAAAWRDQLKTRDKSEE